MVVKMEVVDGKKMGKSVALNLDPEEMVVYPTVAMVKKKVLKSVADTRVFAPDELNDLKFEMKEFLKEWRSELRKREEVRKKMMENVEVK